MKDDNSYELASTAHQHNLQDFSTGGLLAFETVLWAGTVRLTYIYANQGQGGK